MNVVKFEFPDRPELFTEMFPPARRDLIRIEREDGLVDEYLVKSICYTFRDVGSELFGSENRTCCVILESRK